MSNNNGVRFMHYRLVNPTTGTVEGRGGATVAYRLVTNVDGHAVGETVEYAVARCRLGPNGSDNFNRKIGRDISLGRLLKNANSVEFINVSSKVQADGDFAIREFENWMDGVMLQGGGGGGDGYYSIPYYRVRKTKPKATQCGDNSCDCSCPTL